MCIVNTAQVRFLLFKETPAFANMFRKKMTKRRIEPTSYSCETANIHQPSTRGGRLSSNSALNHCTTEGLVVRFDEISSSTFTLCTVISLQSNRTNSRSRYFAAVRHLLTSLQAICENRSVQCIPTATARGFPNLDQTPPSQRLLNISMFTLTMTISKTHQCP